MGLFSVAKLFGMTIRESATDGSDFTNPDADYRRLFLGEDGQLHVKDSAGAVAHIGVPAGTAFPAAPATNDRFYRTNVLGGMEFLWDGTRWKSVGIFRETIPHLALPAAGMAAIVSRHVFGFAGYSHQLVQMDYFCRVDTTNDGSKYHTISPTLQPSTTAITGFTTAAHAAGTGTSVTVALTLVAPATDFWIYLGSATTGAPGPINLSTVVSYRLITT